MPSRWDIVGVFEDACRLYIYLRWDTSGGLTMPCLPAGTHSGVSEGVSAPTGYACPPDRRAASSDSDTSVTGRHFQFQLSNFTDTLPPSDSKLSICLRFSLTQAVGRDRPNVGFGEGGRAVRVGRALQNHRRKTGCFYCFKKRSKAHR